VPEGRRGDLPRPKTRASLARNPVRSPGGRDVPDLYLVAENRQRALPGAACPECTKLLERTPAPAKADVIPASPLPGSQNALQMERHRDGCTRRCGHGRPRPPSSFFFFFFFWRGLPPRRCGPRSAELWPPPIIARLVCARPSFRPRPISDANEPLADPPTEEGAALAMAGDLRARGSPSAGIDAIRA